MTCCFMFSATNSTRLSSFGYSLNSRAFSLSRIRLSLLDFTICAFLCPVTLLPLPPPPPPPPPPPLMLLLAVLRLLPPLLLVLAATAG
jgi:hypothetical protein